jgi:tetratricopeptide (TPR) repeat protein
MAKSVCFVLMPFGVKPDASGRSINFDIVYDKIFKPAVNATGLLPVRADEEQAQGFIHKLMYERLLLSEYAIADLTILNANVYYELGVRHAAKPSTTIMTMAGQTGLPFDVAGLRALPYLLNADGTPTDAAASCAALVEQLKSCIGHKIVDSPIYQLVDGMQPPPIDPQFTDFFKERIAESEAVKVRLARARAGQDVTAIEAVEKSLGDTSQLDASVALDLLTAYRGVGALDKMIELIKGLDPKLSQTAIMLQTLAFAQNRLGQSQEAEETLEQLIRTQGPSAEVSGALGRVYKDRWKKEVELGEDGDSFLADASLKQAIKTYLEGFEADWREAYPGINALTLMEAANDPRRHDLLPAVRYSVQRKLVRTAGVDYWDFATQLEIAVLGDDMDGAKEAWGNALSRRPERWQLVTTADNIRIIANARKLREGSGPCAGIILAELDKRIEKAGK